MRLFRHFIVFVFLSLCTLYNQASADGRLYDNSEVSFISAQELNRQLSSSTVVDVRTAIEFEVLHIVGAHSITMSNLAFVPRIKALCKEQCNLVLYCNGGDCAKSEEAADKLVESGITPVKVLTGGILNWVNSYPEKSLLMGVQPVDKSKLVTEQEFQTKLLTVEQFRQKNNRENVLVVDVRDNFQRVSSGIFKGFDNIKSIPMNRLILLLDGQFARDKTLLIFDAVGEQVKWLQYYLKDRGYEDYYFLKGGISAVPNDLK